MRAFITGATGFIGGHLARRLRERGDEVVALVRSPDKAEPLRGLGCELVRGDLGDETAIRTGVEGCDSAFHSAAMYKVGIPTSQRPEMWEANVRGTERVLGAAVEAGVQRVVYMSTVNAFGNTRAQVVDETHDRPGDEFLSYYDETKFRAHQIAQDLTEKGAPILIAQPGGVYGPGDTSDLANLIDQVRTGRLKFKVFPTTGFNFVHVDDAAEGILLVHDKGRIGEAYVLGGQLTTMGEVVEKIAHLSGRRPPRFTMPPALIRASIPLAPMVTRMMRLPPNLRELIMAADGVTYWASDAEARRELGYAPRDLDTGLRQTLAAL
ncbi:MAG TPA: NAD-dependent epimerase/dehydratase family protein [Actinomycetota bacterium]|nr:NAD-dependent epimerase/dehydratase family protein [Actinomycetota bacterium]